ncbi:MAG TPA: hypothetical protein GXX39_10400 [Syntrophothermus lipocalidus]|uniref:N-acetylmuramoyl-L-alanine amidase n=1 Tax=Syntrophothermus lipocalidus (strain DSM 12680 / TGB-C1) TaxID=643648 RepID=D7CP01_SYNLT|nr:N-acetylmuramoyl-L-alanine amidase [Syntrophothermus lipocalidus]ADI02436.1 N-acetylmuramoyl-L-alanine amidase family 2 [Syntrophothermus lipocalidus DSM 12680]HHV77752.1 hypothetical protein [Syntrophothermus lipocalidus]HOV43501.1 N-acetylmuramoyl-L-alanine amidase [Syntrophothermus lipocalidus]
MRIEKLWLTVGKGGRPGRNITPKGLVIHWTANRSYGANARRNRDYFENHPEKKVAAHYTVDDSEVVQCVPENEMAYHVGGQKYTEKALRILGSYPNSTTIGIEMCVNRDGDFAKTYKQTVQLAAEVLKRHNLGTGDLWRHYDVTGKDCPRYFVDDNTAREFGFTDAASGWRGFIADVKAELARLTDSGSLTAKDIKGHWAEQDIKQALEEGIVSVDESGLFYPDRPATRAEVVAMLMRLDDRILGKIKQ